MAAAALLLPLIPKSSQLPVTYDVWQLGAEIASGGFGKVFYCCNTCNKNFKWAVKIVRRPQSAVGECIAEAEKLRHHNIVRIDEVMTVNKRIWIRMQLCAGPDLFTYIGRLTDSNLLFITQKLLEAVTYLHRRHLVHRDVKPENVVLADDGDRPVLVDLGSMRAEGTLAMSEGTFQYQPPEAQGRRLVIVGKTFDDWSVGATIATVATGKNIIGHEKCMKWMKHPSVTSRPTMQVLLEYAAKMMVNKAEDRLTTQALHKKIDYTKY